MEISERVKQLNLPLGHYVVVGGAMEAFGIRKANDLDIVVTKKLFQDLINQGWAVCDCDKCKEMIRLGDTKRILKKPGVDIISEYTWQDKFRAETDDLIKNAVVINSVPFVKLETLLEWKKAAAREKDLKDIELIKTYLASILKKLD